MNFIKGFFLKVSGEVSKMNLFNFLVFVAGAVEIFKPYIPTEYLPFIIGLIAMGNLYLRTFQSSGEPLSFKN